MKAPKKIPLFNYKNIATNLLFDTKSLEIKFRYKFLNDETLDELESLLAWATIHLEVQSILITSYQDHFIQGFNPEDLKKFSEEEIVIYFNKLRSIAHSLLHLPQTVIVDMKKGARGVGLEIGLSADIRLASPQAVFCFDHLSMGLTLACGAFSFLRPYLNQNTLRSLLLSGIEFQKEGLLALGAWCEFELDSATILQQIFKQAPIARMQSKCGLYGLKKCTSKEELEIEKQIFSATVHSLDYTFQNKFMGPLEFKEKIGN